MHRIYVLLLATVGSMSLLAAALSGAGKSQAEPVPAATARPPERVPVDWIERSQLTLERDRTGQFYLNAAVNGQPVRFLVDTGADLVALSPDEAESLGLVVGEMQPILQTASGVGYAAPVMLDEIEVAGTTLRNVRAIVAQDLPVNLLGQSVLRRLGGVELKGDKMVLRAR